jgi:hypothetical protein
MGKNVQAKKKGQDRNPARFKIQYPMKNRSKDRAVFERKTGLTRVFFHGLDSNLQPVGY